MADLPPLSDPTKRKLAVLWDTLRVKQKLTDEDVSGYDRGRKWLLGVVAKPLHGMNLGGLNTSDRKRAAFWLGLDPSVKAATAWFRGIESEYWRHWCTATDRTEYKMYAAWLEKIKGDIVAELESIWKSHSAVTDRWWEDSCRPALERALSVLIEGRIAQARDEAMRRFDQMARSEAGARTVERTGASKQSASDGRDGKTIEKNLLGETVRNDVLEKLEMADTSKAQTDARISPTVSLARERFVEIASDWFEWWSRHPGWDTEVFEKGLHEKRQAVEAEVAGLWDGSEPQAEQFECECRARVHDALCPPSGTNVAGAPSDTFRELVKRARDTKIQHLRAQVSSTASSSQPIGSTELPANVKQKQVLEWQNLTEKYGFDGPHLRWCPVRPPVRKAPPPPRMLGGFELPSSARRQTIEGNSAGGLAPDKGISSENQSAPARKKRLRPTVYSPIAARRMTYFMESHGGQTAFAIEVGTTDRTLRSFRTTGRIRRDIFDNIARAMGTTAEELHKPE